jgi:hypothetical protein
VCVWCVWCVCGVCVVVCVCGVFVWCVFVVCGVCVACVVRLSGVNSKCKNTETCRSNCNLNFTVLIFAFVGIIKNINCSKFMV